DALPISIKRLIVIDVQRRLDAEHDESKRATESVVDLPVELVFHTGMEASGKAANVLIDDAGVEIHGMMTPTIPYYGIGPRAGPSSTMNVGKDRSGVEDSASARIVITSWWPW